MNHHRDTRASDQATFERYTDPLAALIIYAHLDRVDLDELIACGRARAARTLWGGRPPARRDP